MENWNCEPPLDELLREDVVSRARNFNPDEFRQTIAEAARRWDEQVDANQAGPDPHDSP